MTRKRLFSSLTAFVLCLVMIFNCTSFHRDVEAVVPAVAGAIGIGGAIVVVTAEAIAYFASCLKNGGVEVDNWDDAQLSTEEFLEYILTDVSEDDISVTLESYGFSYNNGVISVSDDNGGIVNYLYYPPTISGTASGYNDSRIEKITYSGEFIDKLTTAGNYVKSGVLTSYDNLANIGAGIYNWLHSGTYEYIPPFVSDVDTFDNIQIAYYTFQQDMAANLGYNFDSETKSISSYSIPDAFNDFEYYRFYFCSYCNGEYNKNQNLLYFACLMYNSDGSYNIVSNCIRQQISDGNIMHFLSNSRISGTDINADDVYSVSLNFGLNAFRKSLSDLSEVGYYINSAVGDITAVDSPAVITDGEKEFTLNPDTTVTVWDTPTAIADSAASSGAYDDNDNTVVTLPGVQTGSSDIDWTDGIPTVFNPDLPDVSTDIPDSVTSSDSILDWIRDFFTHFFDRLSAVLLGVLKVLFLGVFSLPDDFLPKWFDKFQAVFDSKGYNFDFSFFNRSYEECIPDIYITFRGVTSLLVPAKYIYACADVARPLIRAFIYFIILQHDRKRFLYLVRGTLPPENDFEK